MYRNRLFHRFPVAPSGGRLGLLLVLVALLVGWKFWPILRPIFTVEATMGGRLRVSDGDSLDLDGERVRLLGIDAPESDQTCTLAGERHPCGREAREHLLHLIGGRPVTCAWTRLDKYHRRLGRCRAGDTDLNAEMVRGGWAVSYGAYEREEADARAHGRGLWSGDFTWPEDFRREKRSRGHDGVGGWFHDLWR